MPDPREEVSPDTASRPPPARRPRPREGFWAGLLTAGVGSFFWGMFSSLTALHFEWVPLLGMGLLVGVVVGAVGQGTDHRFGLLAALLSQLGCFLGQFWSLWPVAVHQLGYLPQSPFHLPTLLTLFRDQWRPVDLVPYALAAWEGHHVGNCRRSALLGAALQRGCARPLVGCAMFWLGFALFVGVVFLNVHRTRAVGLSLRPDGKALAVGFAGLDASIPHQVVVWDLPGGQATTRTFEQVGGVAWSPDGALLAVLTNTGKGPGADPAHVRLWRPGAPGPPGALLGKTGVLTGLAFSPDGATLAAAGRDGVVKLWDMRRLVGKATLRHDEEAYRVAFSPDGTRLAAGLRDGTITLWDVPAGRAVRSWKAHPAAVSGLVFSADGTELFSAGTVESAVKAWVLARFAPRGVFRLEAGWVTGLSLGPGGRTLVVSAGSVHRPGTVRLLDPATGRERRRFDVHANTVVAAALAPDGKTLLAATAPTINPFTRRRGSEVYRWDVATGEELPPLR